MKRACQIILYVVLGLLLISLCACARKTPTETIVDEHVQHIDQVLDYAHHNISQTKDVIFLENELTNCRTGLVSSKKSYESEIATCEAKTDYWRLSSAGLAVALCVAIYLFLKKRF